MVTVYVRLLDEGVDVRRPVPADVLDHGRYRLATPADYDPSMETWEFPPGSVVECETQPLSDGPALVAVRLVRPCACCGHLTISQEYDICPVCDWEADRVQEGDPDFRAGANDMSLNEARVSYRLIGAKSRDHLAHVRSPLGHERP